MADSSTVTQQVFGGKNQSRRPARPLVDAIKRGAMSRCPACGEGKLFYAFCKTVDSCAVCGEEMHHHRADDLPAYLVITIVGHIVLALFLIAELTFDWTSWQHLALWVPITLILSIGLLQPCKGAVVALQWANYMHGFGSEDERRETHPEIENR